MDMNPRLEAYDDGYAYVLPLTEEHAQQLDMMDWKFVDTVHSALIAIAKGRARKPMDNTDVSHSSKLLEYAEGLRAEILIRAVADGMSYGHAARAMDVERSTAQGRVEAAQKKWHRQWLIPAAQRDYENCPECKEVQE